jgi:hypothetical protein
MELLSKVLKLSVSFPDKFLNLAPPPPFWCGGACGRGEKGDASSRHRLQWQIHWIQSAEL